MQGAPWLQVSERFYTCLHKKRKNWESMRIDFKEEWKHLNPYQMEAVLDDSSSCVVNANVGSGKTTVANLLMRFYDIDSGKILINQQDVRDISRDALRKNVAIVLQDTVLFSDTVLNNLKYGNGDASLKEIEAAVKMSRCREMIERLPQGFDTMLSESGGNISQGQRQLLAIARAFVADPQILILDEES